jgi:hypothetical protein
MRAAAGPGDERSACAAHHSQDQLVSATSSNQVLSQEREQLQQELKEMQQQLSAQQAAAKQAAAKAAAEEGHLQVRACCPASCRCRCRCCCCLHPSRSGARAQRWRPTRGLARVG